MNIGPAEILVILFVALMVFGPQRLPEVGRQVGSMMRELRRIQDTVRGELDSVLHPDLPTDLGPSYDEGSEPPDHSASDHTVPDPIATRTGSAEIAGPDDEPTAPPEAADNNDDDDPRFTGPSDSFI
jgi:sec-independent protein translocase protein TatB